MTSPMVHLQVFFDLFVFIIIFFRKYICEFNPPCFKWLRKIIHSFQELSQDQNLLQWTLLILMYSHAFVCKQLHIF